MSEKRTWHKFFSRSAFLLISCHILSKGSSFLTNMLQSVTSKCCVKYIYLVSWNSFVIHKSPCLYFVIIASNLGQNLRPVWLASNFFHFMFMIKRFYLVSLTSLCLIWFQLVFTDGCLIAIFASKLHFVWFCSNFVLLTVT